MSYELIFIKHLKWKKSFLIRLRFVKENYIIAKGPFFYFNMLIKLPSRKVMYKIVYELCELFH